MKKMILVAILSVVACVVAPVASAGASTGSCTLEGKATLNPALEAAPKNANFTFTSSAGEGSCTVGTYEGSEVHGKGSLSCVVSQNVAEVQGTIEGSGSIKIGGKTDSFAFKLVGASGGLAFTATGESVKAGGAAEFFTSEESLNECKKLHAENLRFKAVTAGEFN